MSVDDFIVDIFCLEIFFSEGSSPTREKKSLEKDSEDEIHEVIINRLSPNIVNDGICRPRSKISRLRAIGNQIR